jgi:Tol biopolymer transport system component
VAFNQGDDLAVAAADGTQQRLLAQAASGPPGSILWSPTGDRVAFTWGYDPSGVTALTNLRVIEVATGTVWELTSADQMEPFRFSPEGDRVLFSASSSDNVPSLWSVNTDGSDRRRLVEGARWGDWQPADQ